jgi:hypothetical protein
VKRNRHLIRNGSLTAATAMLVLAAPAPLLASDAPLPFEAPSDRLSYDRALQCLTEAVYYEARSESDSGQRAVAQVVLNRVRHPSYPSSVCGVVYQGSQRRTGCQFSFTCDGSIGRTAIETGAWARAQRIAAQALGGYVYRPVGLSLNYHTTAIRPYWAPSLEKQTVVGAHIFYRRPDSTNVQAFRQLPSGVEPGEGLAGVTAAARTPRTAAPRLVARVERALMQVEKVERPTIERPTMQRVTFERPTSTRTARPRSVPAVSAQAKPQARPAAASGPRTTIESGVRVARGS